MSEMEVRCKRLETVEEHGLSVEEAIAELREEITCIKSLVYHIYDRYESITAREWFREHGLSEEEVKKITELGRKAEFALWDIEDILKKAIRELEDSSSKGR